MGRSVTKPHNDLAGVLSPADCVIGFVSQVCAVLGITGLTGAISEVAFRCELMKGKVVRLFPVTTTAARTAAGRPFGHGADDLGLAGSHGLVDFERLSSDFWMSKVRGRW